MKNSIVLFIIFFSSQLLADKVVLIPSSLFELLLSPRSEETNQSKTRKYFFAPIQVELRKQITKNKEFETVKDVKFKEGGGVLDLAPYLNKNRGEIYNLLIKLNSSVVSSNTLRVYYLPRVKPKVIEGTQFGSACGQFLDLSQSFKAGGFLSTHGIELSAFENTYVHTLGGDFYFSWEEGSETYTTRVQFIDSRYQPEECGPL